MTQIWLHAAASYGDVCSANASRKAAGGLPRLCSLLGEGYKATLRWRLVVSAVVETVFSIIAIFKSEYTR